MDRYGLKTRLIANLTGLTFLSLTLVGVLSYRAASRIVYDLTLADLDHRLQSVEAAVKIAYEDDTDRQKHLSRRLHDHIAPRLRVDRARLTHYRIEDQISHETSEIDAGTLLIDGRPLNNHALVDEIGDESDAAITFFIRIPQGLLRASTNLKRADGSRAVGTYIPPSSPVYQEIVEGRPHYGRAFVVDDWYVTAYVPLRQNGEVVGAFFCGSRDTAFPQVKAHLKAQRLLETGYFYIFDAQGKMLLHPTLEGQSVIDTLDADGSPLFKRMLEAKQGTISYRWLNAETKQVQQKLAIFRQLPMTDWTIAASFNVAEAKAETRHLAWLLTAIILTVVFFSGLFAGWLARSVTRQLGELLARLSKSSDAITAESGQLANTARQLTTASTSQASAVQQTVAATDELSAIVTQNQESAQFSEKLSEESRAAAQNGSQVMNHLDQSVAELARQNAETLRTVGESYEQVRQISRLMQTIEDKTKVIHDIVFQTKLLSFNASVEAARAGEHGKGFAVVAEEVGKLAQLTGTSAQQIQKVVAESLQQVESIIQASTSRMHSTMDESDRRVRECVDVSKQATKALEQILQNIEKTHQAAGTIASSSREQATGISQIAQAMQHIDTATHDNTRLAQQTQAQSEHMKTQSETLREVAQQLKVLAEGDREKSIRGLSPAAKTTARPKLRVAA